MHFRSTPKVLAKALARCAAITNPRSPHPIAATLLLDVHDCGVYIHATDYERSLIELVAAGEELTVDEPGVACVPGGTLADTIQQMPKDAPLDVFLDNRRKKLRLKTPDSDLLIALYKAEEFPVIPSFGENARSEIITVDGALVERLLRLTEWCVAEGDLLELGGVCLEVAKGDLMMTATNKRCLIHCVAPGVATSLDDDIREVLPRASVERLSHVAALATTVDLALTANRIMLRSAPISYFSGPLIAGRYPQYRDLFPNEQLLQRSFTVDRQGFLNALRQAKTFTSYDSWSIVMWVEPGTGNAAQLAIRGRSPEKGEALIRLPIQCVGRFEDVRIAFNPDFFLQGIRLLPADEIRLEFANSPRKNEIVDRCMIRSEFEGVRYTMLAMSTSLPPE